MTTTQSVTSTLRAQQAAPRPRPPTPSLTPPAPSSSPLSLSRSVMAPTGRMLSAETLGAKAAPPLPRDQYGGEVTGDDVVAPPEEDGGGGDEALDEVPSEVSPSRSPASREGPTGRARSGAKRSVGGAGAVPFTGGSMRAGDRGRAGSGPGAMSPCAAADLGSGAGAEGCAQAKRRWSLGGGRKEGLPRWGIRNRDCS